MAYVEDSGDKLEFEKADVFSNRFIPVGYV